MNTQVDAEVVVEELTLEEGREMLNRLTRDRLGIGADEFLRKLADGEYEASEDELIFKLKMLATFAA